LLHLSKSGTIFLYATSFTSISFENSKINLYDIGARLDAFVVMKDSSNLTLSNTDMRQVGRIRAENNCHLSFTGGKAYMGNGHQTPFWSIINGSIVMEKYTLTGLDNGTALCLLILKNHQL